MDRPGERPPKIISCFSLDTHLKKKTICPSKSTFPSKTGKNSEWTVRVSWSHSRKRKFYYSFMTARYFLSSLSAFFLQKILSWEGHSHSVSPASVIRQDERQKCGWRWEGALESSNSACLFWDTLVLWLGHHNCGQSIRNLKNTNKASCGKGPE